MNIITDFLHSRYEKVIKLRSIAKKDCNLLKERQADYLISLITAKANSRANVFNSFNKH